MKRFAMLAALLAGAIFLPSCSTAKGLAQTVGRTVSSASRTVGNVGSAVTR